MGGRGVLRLRRARRRPVAVTVLRGTQVRAALERLRDGRVSGSGWRTTALGRLIQSVVSVNDPRKVAMAERVISACGGSVAGSRIAILGLAFKPETDDMREAPSLPLIGGLLDAGANVVGFDPVAMDVAKAVLPPAMTFAPDAITALTGADAMVLVTEWNEFRALAPARLEQLMRGKIVVDLRNVFDPVAMREAGIGYFAIGRAALPRTD